MSWSEMAKLVEMDERVGIFTQMEEDVGPVILINKFSVDPKEFDQFLKGYTADSEEFKQQPGFISTQLHKGIGGSGTFVNYAVWESAAHFKRAVNNVMNPNDRLSAFPASTALTYSRKLQSQESV
jgi:quinol monooxygenase YgiN